MSVLGALQIGRAEQGPNARIGRLFMVGSFCFALASLPFMSDFDARVAGVIYFIGSVFFTAAGAETFRCVEDGNRLDLVASAVQLVGTIMFNVNCYAALFDGLDRHTQKGLVWLPDALGSVAFLVASWIALVVWQRARRAGTGDRRGGEIAWLNMIGSLFFGLSAIASQVVGKGAAAEPRGRNLVHVRRRRLLPDRRLPAGAAGAPRHRRGYSPRCADEARFFFAGVANSEGSVGTSGFSISAIRSTRRFHCFGFSTRVSSVPGEAEPPPESAAE